MSLISEKHSFQRKQKVTILIELNSICEMNQQEYLFL